ncbi:MAG: ABC transporter ATP-binding protein [Lachnospiraceae bacterium]
MKRILKQVAHYWYFYLIAFIAMIIAIVLDMMAPQIIQRLIDEVIMDGQMQNLMKFLLSLLFIGIGRAIFSYIKEFLFELSSVHIAGRIRNSLFKHIQSLSLKFFHKNTTGELMARVKDDVDRIWNSVGFVGMLLFEATIHCGFVIYFMLKISPELTMIPLIILPLVAFTAIRLEKKLGDAYDKISEENAVLTTVAQENLAGVRTVKSFAREKHEIEKFLSHNENYYNLNVNQARLLAKYNPNIQFLARILLVMVIIFGGNLVVKGEITLGQLGAFTEYANNIVWPMEVLAWIANELAAAMASYKKIDHIHKETPDIRDPEQPVDKVTVKGCLEFDHVSFSIDGSEILKDISFALEEGKTLGIMGSTGSGKSSIVNLIERFYDVNHGEIRLDGENIKNYSLKQLRDSMAIVMQDVFLFSDTIEENIAIGIDEELDGDDLRQAAAYACANNFIKSLSNKYETVVGERGVGLSGGQKQRISIARALIKHAPILIFDDSTSALDMETEYEIQNSLSQIDDSSKLIIAHRISVVKDADEIIILDNGRIAERGTHDTLLKEKGLYYKTYIAQYGSYGLEEVSGACP